MTGGPRERAGGGSRADGRRVDGACAGGRAMGKHKKFSSVRGSNRRGIRGVRRGSGVWKKLVGKKSDVLALARSIGVWHRTARRRGQRFCRRYPGSGCSSGVEHNLAKVGVEGSNPFARSILPLGRHEVGRRKVAFFVSDPLLGPPLDPHARLAHGISTPLERRAGGVAPFDRVLRGFRHRFSGQRCGRVDRFPAGINLLRSRRRPRFGGGGSSAFGMRAGSKRASRSGAIDPSAATQRSNTSRQARNW